MVVNAASENCHENRRSSARAHRSSANPFPWSGPGVRSATSDWCSGGAIVAQIFSRRVQRGVFFFEVPPSMLVNSVGPTMHAFALTREAGL